MKKLLYIVSLLLGMFFTSCNDGNIDDINRRLDAIENNKIATISQQITSINSSILLLENINNSLASKDVDIENRIKVLTEYVDTELKASNDWVQATFATLEQYNALAKEIAAFKAHVEGIQGSLSASISALEASMKGWVNSQLTGYYTISEIDTKIKILEATIVEGDEELQKEIDDLKEAIARQKADIADAYQKAIEEAITINNGMIDDKIAAEIANINDQITAIQTSLKILEERVSEIEEAIDQIKGLDITFETTDKACLAGASVYIGYAITGGDAETSVEAWGDGGWSADVVAESTSVGRIVATAPNEISKRGKIIVLATSGAGGVAMKSLYFDEGVLTGIFDTYEVDWEACSLQVTFQTNINYTVEIPAEAKEWLTFTENTRATIQTETLIFSVAENPDETPRSTTVSLIGECGDVISSFIVSQKLQPFGIIEFADTYAKLVCVEKFDTNGDGEVSIKEASKVTKLDYYFFGDYAEAIFYFNELRHFINLTQIPDCAFKGCSNLVNITLPANIAYIGDHAFYGCKNLEAIDIPNGVTEIGDYAFYNCKQLASVVIPNSVTSFGNSPFFNCAGLIDVVLGNGIKSIDESGFGGCSSLTNVTFGTGISSIGYSAFYDCRNLLNVYCKAITPPSLDASFYFQKDMKFYVPTESVWLYQTTKWKNYADNIVGYDFE